MQSSDIDKLKKIQTALLEARSHLDISGPEFDSLLKQFDQILEHMIFAREARNQLISIHSGFNLLLDLLGSNREPLQSDQLCCLLEPLTDRIGQQADVLETIVG